MAKILCVDDDADGMASRRDVLERDAHEVREAASANQALLIMKTEEIDLAIVDYYLVNTTGVALATEMKRLNSPLAIIVLSGFGQLPREAVGIVNSWILKGSGPEQPVRELQKARKNKGSRQFLGKLSQSN
jgi:DNA-binding NtrC family response regulator